MLRLGAKKQPARNPALALIAPSHPGLQGKTLFKESGKVLGWAWEGLCRERGQGTLSSRAYGTEKQLHGTGNRNLAPREGSEHWIQIAKVSRGG